MTEERGITVTQLNNYIKQVFEAEELLHNVEVVGELSGVKQSGNAVYFTLKDEAASIPCVTFVPAVMRDGMKLFADGTKVVVRGSVSYWHKAGKISFIINKCEKVGLSPLYLLFLQLQEKLKAEGLFDTAVKKSIPYEVKRIGVVTSKSGAVIHDIKTVAHRRNPSVDIAVIDTRVQGVGADAEIASAIRLFNTFTEQQSTASGGGQTEEQTSGGGQNAAPKPVDVIIVARGGGSAEDLTAFNSESVARAVFASKIPVVSAVGHESDFTLIDFVSDLRAPTPSAAAELCVREILTARDKAIQLWNTLCAVTLSKSYKAVKEIGWGNLKSAALAQYSQCESKISVLAARIEANNPMAILAKGFTHTAADLNAIKTGDEFEILYYNDKDKSIDKGVAEWKRKSIK